LYSRSVLALVTLVGCAKGVDNGFGGSFTASVGTTPTTQDGGDDDTTGEDDGVQTSSISADASASDTSVGDSSSASQGDSEGEGSTSGVDAGESTSGDPDTTGMNTSNTTNMSGEESSSDDGNPGGGQPADGMYSSCTMANNTCTMAPVTICVYTDTDGFCTADGCANPAQDCDPAPGGTATPMCLSAPPYSFCALDCSGGESCPTPMVCTGVTFDMVTNYDICI
jgi:hypothetical protein